MAAPRIVHTDEMDWTPSPSPGVARKRLELDGSAEAGRVTSVVRYEPGSAFSRHPHPDGEEILVLEGVFSDERGDHPAGTYMLNPEGYEHAPSSRPGCVLFVKLRQYPGVGRTQIRIDTGAGAWTPHPDAGGVARQILYAEPQHPETVALVRFEPGASASAIARPGGEEIFVLEGTFDDEHGSYRAGSWLKLAPGLAHAPRTETGCLLYVKLNHLGR